MSQLNHRDLDRLATELASFARSDIPMPQGLAQLQQSLPAGNLKTLSSELTTATDQGQPLSDAMAASSISVPPSFIALVRCGEHSGDMAAVLDFSLRHGRMLRRHRSSMATVLIYPVLVLVVLLVIMAGASFFIVPQFLRIFGEVGAELPWLTQLSVAIAKFLYSPFGLVLVLVLLAAAAYTLYAVFTDRLSSRYIEAIPGVRNLVYLSDTAIMTEFIGHMIDRGVPLPEACRAASTVVYNQHMRSSLEEMADESERGAASADKLHPRIPATAAWLYRQGESRGTLGETCKSIASYCESRFELLSRRTLYLIEPAFILIISILIGLVVISFYLPLFNLPRVLV